MPIKMETISYDEPGNRERVARLQSRGVDVWGAERVYVGSEVLLENISSDVTLMNAVLTGESTAVGLTEQLTFEDSRNSLGLQLADMLAITLRRGLNNRLQRPGWENLGKLIIRSTDPGLFIQLGHSEPRRLGGTALDVYRAMGQECEVHGPWIK
jgi:hypothetical protein